MNSAVAFRKDFEALPGPTQICFNARVRVRRICNRYNLALELQSFAPQCCQVAFFRSAIPEVLHVAASVAIDATVVASAVRVQSQLMWTGAHAALPRIKTGNQRHTVSSTRKYVKGGQKPFATATALTWEKEPKINALISLYKEGYSRKLQQGRISMVNAETVAKLPSVLKPVTDEQGANAAVTLLLKPKASDFEILLAKRAQHPTDPWSGQMALPGGKREPQDADLKSTVTREVLEETSINLCASRFFGVLNAVHSEPRRDLLILPFVILLRNEPRVTLNTAELKWHLWFPYEQLIRTNGKTKQSGFGEVPAFLLENAIVWGITYRILNEFVKIVDALIAH